MAQRGWETKIVTGRTVEPQENLPAYSARTGVPIEVVDSLVRELEPRNDLKALAALRKIIRRESPVIVHTNSSKGGILGRIAARLNRVPAIIHSPHGHIFYGYYGKLKTAIFILMEKWTARFTDRITTLTSLGREDHLKLKIGPPEMFTVIHAGIDIDKFMNPRKSRGEVRRELNLPDDAFVAGWVGRMADIKNPQQFVKAAALLKQREDLRFLMVGGGAPYDSVYKKAVELGISEKMVFTRHREDVPDLLNAMDIYVLTSLNEGLGRSILEAQAAGLPVAAAEVGGVPEIIIDGLTGLLTIPNSEESTADAIVRLSNDPDLRKRIVSEARERLFLFSLEKTLDDIDNLYREVLSLNHHSMDSLRESSHDEKRK